MTRVLAALAAVALLVSGASAQFKVGSQVVAVYTTVTDGAGKIVTDLPQDAFEVYDNGKPQTITQFANDIQPITITVLLDRSLSMLGNFALVQKAAETFVERLLPKDKARIGSFSHRIELDPRDFTPDKDELLQILRTELQDPGPTPLWNAIAVGMTALLHQEGRRVILVFTDGMDEPGNGNPNNLSLGAVTKRADEEDVMIYAIGLIGDRSGAFHGGRGGYGGRGGGYGGRGGYGGYGGGHGGQQDRPDPGLEKLAGASGGGYFELTTTNDLGATFARVADELHRQYLLGFVPQQLDGKSHKLEVRVKDPALVVRARKSYVAKRES